MLRDLFSKISVRVTEFLSGLGIEETAVRWIMTMFWGL